MPRVPLATVADDDFDDFSSSEGNSPRKMDMDRDADQPKRGDDAMLLLMVTRSDQVRSGRFSVNYNMYGG